LLLSRRVRLLLIHPGATLMMRGGHPIPRALDVYIDTSDATFTMLALGRCSTTNHRRVPAVREAFAVSWAGEMSFE